MISCVIASYFRADTAGGSGFGAAARTGSVLNQILRRVGARGHNVQPAVSIKAGEYDTVNKALVGIVAKRKDGLYTPGATTWVKIKNRATRRLRGGTAATIRRSVTAAAPASETPALSVLYSESINRSMTRIGPAARPRALCPAVIFAVGPAQVESEDQASPSTGHTAMRSMHEFLVFGLRGLVGYTCRHGPSNRGRFTREKNMQASAMQVSPDEVRAFIQEYFDAWKGMDDEKILSYYSDDVVLQLPTGTIEGKAAVRDNFVRPFISGFPGNVHAIRNLAHASNLVAVEWSFDAVHKGSFANLEATGKVVRVLGCSFYEYDLGTRKNTGGTNLLRCGYPSAADWRGSIAATRSTEDAIMPLREVKSSTMPTRRAIALC